MNREELLREFSNSEIIEELERRLQETDWTDLQHKYPYLLQDMKDLVNRHEYMNN